MLCQRSGLPKPRDEIASRTAASDSSATGSDEELKGSGTNSGLQLLTGGGYYDPSAGRYVNRFGGDDNEYRYAWKALGLVGLAGQKAAQQAKADINANLDNAQLALDTIGLIPGFGEPFDIASGGLSFFRGDYVGATLSLGAAIPGAGEVAGVAKISKAFAKRSTKGASLVAKASGPVNRLILGEGMESRVIPKAWEVGARYYGGHPEFGHAYEWMTKRMLWGHNKRWLQRRIDEGYEILDYGIDPLRATRSRYYAAEKALLKRLGIVPIPIK